MTKRRLMVPSTRQLVISKALHRDIAKGSLVVALFVLLAGIARGALEVFIAWRYGVSDAVDAYYFVLNIVSWPISIWFSTLTVVLVPLFARIRQDAADDLPRFRAELLGATITLSLVVATIMFVGLKLLFWSSLSGLAETARGVASDVSNIFSLLIPLGFLAGLLSVWFIAANRQLGTLLDGVPALVVVLVLLFASSTSLKPLVWGTVAGFAARLVLLHVLLHQRERVDALAFDLRSPWWGVFGRSCGVMLAGQALMALTLVVDQFFAAHQGTGSVASFNYANRILAIVLLLGAASIQRATLPVFSSAFAGGDTKLPSVIGDWVRLMMFVGLLAVVAGWLLAPTGIALLFEREAFTAADTLAVTSLFRFGLLQVPMYFSGLVLVSALAARGLHGVIALSGLVALGVKCVANAALVPIFGLEGLMLGTGAMYSATLAYLLWFVRRAV